MDKTHELYEQFRAELREQDGNFYFVRKYDRALYKKLTKAEGKALTDLMGSGSRLRTALENFRSKAMPDELEPEVRAHFNARPKHPKETQPVLADYEYVFSHHPELRVDTNLFREVRKDSNPFHHEPLPNEPPSKKPRTYGTLLDGFRAMQKLLCYYYTGKKNITYHKERQPIDGYWICSSIDRADITACERQVLCAHEDENHPGQVMYRLVRQYAASDLTEDAIRDEKVLNSLWYARLRSPQNIIRYSVIPVTYEGEARKLDEKRLLGYDFGSYCPSPLNEKMAAALNEEQRIRLLHDMANGVRELHRAGVCHRNLQPNSVFVFFERDSDFVQAKLVGFEFAKISGDARTVYSSVQELYTAGDPSAYISNAVLTALKNPAAAARIDWEKEDIYSLGALFHLVLAGRPPRAGRPSPELTKTADPALVGLITQMLSPAPAQRPAIGEVCRTILDYFRLVEGEEY